MKIQLPNWTILGEAMPAHNLELTSAVINRSYAPVGLRIRPIPDGDAGLSSR